ncbi:hypothetical protein QET40_06720 [Akkermansia sp. N21169]|nr:hypothetical protein [Akkermansia sp. N21169]
MSESQIIDEIKHQANPVMYGTLAHQIADLKVVLDRLEAKIRDIERKVDDIHRKLR